MTAAEMITAGLPGRSSRKGTVGDRYWLLLRRPNDTA
jgi:hypothetical protein